MQLKTKIITQMNVYETDSQRWKTNQWLPRGRWNGVGRIRCMRLRDKLLSIKQTSNKDTQDRELYLYHVITSNGIIIRKNTDSLCWTPESNIIPESRLQVCISTSSALGTLSLLSRLKAITHGRCNVTLPVPQTPLCKMSNSSWWAAGPSISYKACKIT